LTAQVLPELKSEYRGAPALGEHLVRALAKADFDVARSNRLREDVGLGHAFTYLFQLLPDCEIPVVPFMVNTYFPPNAPTPKRCYALGQALRQAIESWPEPARVAVMASGGLSHQVIDEEIDQMTINGLLEKDREALCALPEERLVLGTSEIRNWVVLAGAMEPLPMTLIDYIPAYRSPAGTGCAMGFASWR
jgi:aromatic ring-opening dioxygenase catalytic subunit (LigB family)